MEFGVRCWEFGVWNLDSGVWSLESGLWNLDFGFRWPATRGLESPGQTLPPFSPRAEARQSTTQWY
ncbi:MAG: hypothetical protein DME57_04755 [Verrucomicrobia bacterium]|nr:MAG: hypothetical protein DME57_04755 [Verrucomicrobiota bacterium]